MHFPVFYFLSHILVTKQLLYRLGEKTGVGLLQSFNLYLSIPKLSALCGQPIKLRGAYEGLVTHKELNAF